MPEFITLNFIRDWRARADDAHVTTKHVKELRKLVQTGLAQDLSQARDALVSSQFVSRPILVAEI
jgi:hypothetical protein